MRGELLELTSTGIVTSLLAGSTGFGETCYILAHFFITRATILRTFPEFT
jgi:hypothetical protein